MLKWEARKNTNITFNSTFNHIELTLFPWMLKTVKKSLNIYTAEDMWHEEKHDLKQTNKILLQTFGFVVYFWHPALQQSVIHCIAFRAQPHINFMDQTHVTEKELM